jgi:hypothetical protein
MIAKMLAMGAMATTAATAQNYYVTRVWFPDGAEVQVHAETTGGTRQAVPGGGGVHDGHLFRILQDSRYNIVFEYELEAHKVRDSDAVTIRIRPASGGTPTVSGVREFTAVKLGQEVKVEILTNPSTGEKVFDVFRPADEPNPYPGTCNVSATAFPSTTGVKLLLNGKALWLTNLWSAGKPARLYLPGHGAYYLSWENRPKFRLAGYMQGNRMVFLIDTEYVQMTFDSSVPTPAEGGPIWIYHDPGYVSRDIAELDVADLEALHVH